MHIAIIHARAHAHTDTGVEALIAIVRALTTQLIPIAQCPPALAGCAVAGWRSRLR